MHGWRVAYDERHALLRPGTARGAAGLGRTIAGGAVGMPATHRSVARAVRPYDRGRRRSTERMLPTSENQMPAAPNPPVAPQAALHATTEQVASVVRRAPIAIVVLSVMA